MERARAAIARCEALLAQGESNLFDTGAATAAAGDTLTFKNLQQQVQAVQVSVLALPATVLQESTLASLRAFSSAGAASAAGKSRLADQIPILRGRSDPDTAQQRLMRQTLTPDAATGSGRRVQWTVSATQRSFTIHDSPASLTGSTIVMLEGAEAQALKSIESVPIVKQLQSDLTGLAKALEPYKQAAAAKLNVDRLSQADQQEQVFLTPHQSTCSTQAASRCSVTIQQDMERRFEEQAGNKAGNNCNNQLDDSERCKFAMESQRLETEQIRSGERASSPHWRESRAGLMLECPPAPNIFDSILFGLTRAEAAEKQLQLAERNLKSVWEREKLAKAQLDTLARKVEESNKVVEDLRMQISVNHSSFQETEKKLTAQVAYEKCKAHELEGRVNQLHKVAEEKLCKEVLLKTGEFQKAMAEQIRVSLEHINRKDEERKKAADRLIDTCKRVVKRMLRQHLSSAWTSFHESVMQSKANRETVHKVLKRMSHRSLTLAFEGYSRAVSTSISQREKVAKVLSKVIARWTIMSGASRAGICLRSGAHAAPGCPETPSRRLHPGVLLIKALEAWVDYVDITRQERAEEAKELAESSLLAKLRQEQIEAGQVTEELKNQVQKLTADAEKKDKAMNELQLLLRGKEKQLQQLLELVQKPDVHLEAVKQLQRTAAVRREGLMRELEGRAEALAVRLNSPPEHATLS
jgi:hypothetical protein